jgi:hypothetical protein
MTRTDEARIEQWKLADGTLIEVRPISKVGRTRNPKLLRVREVGKKEWYTWNPDYLRERATKVEGT